MGTRRDGERLNAGGGRTIGWVREGCLRCGNGWGLRRWIVRLAGDENLSVEVWGSDFFWGTESFQVKEEEVMKLEPGAFSSVENVHASCYWVVIWA